LNIADEKIAVETKQLVHRNVDKTGFFFVFFHTYRCSINGFFKAEIIAKLPNLFADTGEKK
jgi:hypothetical protein